MVNIHVTSKLYRFSVVVFIPAGSLPAISGRHACSLYHGKKGVFYKALSRSEKTEKGVFSMPNLRENKN